MSEFPSLIEISAEYNLLASYMKYVDRCIDDRILPTKYHEWIWHKENTEKDFGWMLDNIGT